MTGPRRPDARRRARRIPSNPSGARDARRADGTATARRSASPIQLRGRSRIARVADGRSRSGLDRALERPSAATVSPGLARGDEQPARHRRPGARPACGRARRRWPTARDRSVQPGTVSRAPTDRAASAPSSPSSRTASLNPSSSTRRSIASSPRWATTWQARGPPGRRAACVDGGEALGRRLDAPSRQSLRCRAHGRSGSSPARALRASGLRGRGPEPVATPWGEALVSRGTWAGVEVLHISRHGAGPPAALQPRHAPGEHRGAEVVGATGVLAVTVCGAVDPSRRAGLAGRASTTCTSSPTGSATASSARSSPSRARAARALDLRGAVLAGAARARCSTGAAEAGVTVRDGGCYGHVDGPRFNTRAEIRGLAAVRRHRGVPDRRARRRCCAARPSCRTRCSAS